MARGVKGMWPPGTGSVSSDEISLMVATVSSYVTSSFASACAAMPSPSRMSASSRCSVPTYILPRPRASSCARLMTLRALSVNFSNMRGLTPPILVFPRAHAHAGPRMLVCLYVFTPMCGGYNAR